MPATAPQDSTIAVVGDGFGSLIVHATAMYVDAAAAGDRRNFE
jgi:hypothetical protein